MLTPLRFRQTCKTREKVIPKKEGLEVWCEVRKIHHQCSKIARDKIERKWEKKVFIHWLFYVKVFRLNSLLISVSLPCFTSESKSGKKTWSSSKT